MGGRVYAALPRGGREQGAACACPAIRLRQHAAIIRLERRVVEGACTAGGACIASVVCVIAF